MARDAVDKPRIPTECSNWFLCVLNISHLGLEFCYLVKYYVAAFVDEIEVVVVDFEVRVMSDE